MRLPTILFATAVCPVLVTPVFPQHRVGRSCQGSADGGVTITFNQPGIMRPVTGAPYSAIQSHQSVQTLADGTHLTHNGREESARWRDSYGRVRTETRVMPERALPCDAIPVEIDDPVAGYVYVQDPVDQVAYRLPLRTPSNHGIERALAQKPATRPAQPSPGEPALTTESLGEKTMFGITVVGTRTTTTYPAGSRMGNDRPVAITSDTWVSPELKLAVYSQSTSYGETVSTTTLKDLSVAEPDPSLLQVPPGYKIIDENGPFTIHQDSRP